MSERSSRRDFLTRGAAAGAGFFTLAGLTPTVSHAAAEKIRVAGIGVGGKGRSDIDQAANHADVVAICDIDDSAYGLGGAAEALSKKGQKPKHFTDYRKMLDAMGKSIDAVTVSTPDHTHAHASILAMRMGKHVYCQKPLTHSVYEARLMRTTAKEMKVATQMGNQGTAENGLRRAVEIIQAGILGQVKEVHVWTNRPIWPQGADAILKVGAANKVAAAALHGKAADLALAKAPPHVHWDEFLGPAQYRPYDPIYHPFSWRGWWDYGTGALGDMACHTANMAFMALKLGYPESVVAEDIAEVNPETYPTHARVAFQFPAREGMGPARFVWYEGQYRGQKLLPPEKLFHGRRPVASGSLLVGEKGILYSPNDYGASYEFLGEGANDLAAAAKKVAQTLPRLTGEGRRGGTDDTMKREWAEAIRTGKPATSNFDYAAMLTEAILLGNVAMRAGQGQKLQWDGPGMRFTNNTAANQYLKRDYRKGWEL